MRHLIACRLLRYCASIPPYYLPSLRVAFKRMGLPAQLIPELREGIPSAFAKELKHIQKQAKVRLIAPIT